MDMKEEMMNDAIDDVMGDEEDDEERYNIGFYSSSNEKVSYRGGLIVGKSSFP